MSSPGPEWDQCDVVDGAYYFAAFDDVRPAIVLTPACDIEQSKVDIWTLVALYPDTMIARVLLEADFRGWAFDPAAPVLKPLTSGQRDAVKKKLGELFKHSFQRYHWIPLVVGEHLGFVADFTHITSLPADEVRKLRRIASLASSWREQVPARYAAFMGRVGTNDFGSNEIAQHIERLFAAVCAPPRPAHAGGATDA